MFPLILLELIRSLLLTQLATRTILPAMVREARSLKKGGHALTTGPLTLR
jgi:hypothetical protein